MFVVEVAGEHGAQGADPLVGGGVREAAERREGVRLLGEGVLGQGGDPVHHVEHHVVDEGGPVGEVPVEGGVADPGPAGDLVEGGVRAELHQHLAGRHQDPLAVAHRVGARLRDPARAARG